MLNFIVSGFIPGTNFQITFLLWLVWAIGAAACLAVVYTFGKKLVSKLASVKKFETFLNKYKLV